MKAASALALGLRKKQSFRCNLLEWYSVNKRDLPWRRDREPYRVWLSEIMLQQTRVAAAVEHYRQFLRRFPDVKKLAGARGASVLTAWSGLGYYRRARMLHAAAKVIVKEHAGKFPGCAEELRALPGVGRYTAAAVASIAFGEPVAVVDGNVERVLRRISGRELSAQSAWQGAEELLDRTRPGDFNQAMMELGAVICLPRQPKCLLCPVAELCAVKGEGTKRAKGIRQHKREIHYALDQRNGSVLLVRRPKDARVMAGMWELPEIPISENHNADDGWLILRHSITVTDYDVRVKTGPAPGVNGNWVEKSRLQQLPLTGLVRKILRAAGILGGSGLDKKPVRELLAPASQPLQL